MAFRTLILALLFTLSSFGGELDPRGKVHIAIGQPNSLDRLKTFVEPEGNFSPGVGSYGIYFWATDPARGKLVAPTMDGVKVEYGLGPRGALTPWSQWSVGPIQIRSELRHFADGSAKVPYQMTLARVQVTNTGNAKAKTRFIVALRPIGPAGFDVKKICPGPNSLTVNDFFAVAACFGKLQPKGIALPTDTIAQAVVKPAIIDSEDAGLEVQSPTGDCSGAIVYELALEAGDGQTINLIFPVHPGRHVLGHQWDGVSKWAQFDLAPYAPSKEGKLQPDYGPCYLALEFDDLWGKAGQSAAELASGTLASATLKLPDPRWADALGAITGHVALAMNDGAPDVAVVNYNVFNRDGVYVTNILQKAGQLDLAEKCIDYLLSHPFNGRVQPEADNPGQILWIIGEHRKFAREKYGLAYWQARIYPGVKKLAEMIRYYRTTPEPHWVWDTSLDFGDALPKDRRKQLKPGACDGFHPEYTEAFDIAGLRAAADLARAVGKDDDAKSFDALAAQLMAQYDAKFNSRLAKDYGSFSVLWPCRLYPLSVGKAHETFKDVGPQNPAGWRYFPLAKAHQSLLAGNRRAGFETINTHLDHPQMRGFYAFDEGGKSGAGGWTDSKGKKLLRTTWNPDVAMPHGWAIAELHLLIRDSLVYENQDELVLLAGVPPQWFKSEMVITNLPTHFGDLTLKSTPTADGVTIEVSGAAPPAGFVIQHPATQQPHRIKPGQSRVELKLSGPAAPPATSPPPPAASLPGSCRESSNTRAAS